MRIIITVALLLVGFVANAQRYVPIGGSRTTDTGLISQSLKVDSLLVLPYYRTTNENLVLGFDSRGKAVLRINNDSLIYATRRYVDSGFNAITAGSVDSSIYSTVTRLSDSLHNLRDYVDSNNTIIYAEIDTANFNISEAFVEIGNLQSEFTNVYDSILVLDSAIGVAFGAITDLYDTKADKDTLTNFLLKSDTATLSNRINLKQNYSDTTTWDATRYWVSTQIPSLAGYVPYTGATTDVDLGTHSILARTGVINKPSGSGTALSVTKGGSGEALTVTKTSGSGNAMSVSGGVTQLSELHTTTKIADAYISSAATWNAKGTVNSVATGYGLTGGTITNTGTISADSTELATKALVKKQIDSVAALSGGGTLTSIQLVGGTGVTITPTIAATTVGVFTISATGGGGGSPVSATATQVVYKGGSDTLKGASSAVIDSTDGRLVFPQDTTTSTVNAFYGGGTKIVGSNRMGMSALVLVDTVSIPAALQRAVNAQTISTMLPSVAATYNLAFTGGFAPVSGQLPAPSGTNAIVASAPSSIQHLKLTKTLFTTAAGANAACSLRVTSLAAYSGLVGGTTKFSKGGGRGTFTFSFPTYASTERIMIGYLSGLTPNFSGEPSAVIADAGALMLIKESTDTTLFFYHKALNSLPAATSKVNTGVVPNNEDVYRLTVYVSPISTYYMQLEILSTTGTRTIVINPTTNIQPPSSKFVSYQGVNNGTVGGAVSYGLIQMMEEIY